MRNPFRTKPTKTIYAKKCVFEGKITSMFWDSSCLDYDTNRFSEYLSTLKQFEIVRSKDDQIKRAGKMSNFCNNKTPQEFKKDVEEIKTDLFKYVVEVCNK